MTISEIQDYLKFRRQARLDDFLRHFNDDPTRIEEQLEVYVKRGELREDAVPNCCGSDCEVCDTGVSKVYELT